MTIAQQLYDALQASSFQLALICANTGSFSGAAGKALDQAKFALKRYEENPFETKDNESAALFESGEALAKTHYQYLTTLHQCIQVALKAGDAPEVRAQLECYRAEVIELLINTAESLP